MSKTPDQIRTQMQWLRRSLDDDVDQIVESAREMTDWKNYLRRYPWASLTVAAAVGYLVVPNRIEIMSPDADTLLKLAKKNKLVINANPEPQKRSGIVGALFTLVAATATRGVTSYLGNKVGPLIGSQLQAGRRHKSQPKQPMS